MKLTAVQSLVPQVPAVGIAPNWVQEAASAFMMQSPTALAVARQVFPDNSLLIRTSAATLAELHDRVVSGAEPRQIGSLAQSAALVACGFSCAFVLPMAGMIGLYCLDPGSPLLATNAVGSFVGGISIMSYLGTRNPDFGKFFGSIFAGMATGALILGGWAAFKAGAAGALGGGLWGAGVGLIVGGITGVASWGFEKLASAFDALLDRRRLREIMAWADDPQQQRAFFDAHPLVHAHFLGVGISSLFRAQEGEAKSRIDALRTELFLLQRSFKVACAAAEAVDGGDSEERSRRLEELRRRCWEGMTALVEALDLEAGRIAAIEGFVTAALWLAQRLQLQTGTFDVLAAGIDGLMDRTEQEQIGGTLSLEDHWDQLRAMGDQVVARHQGIEEVDRLLSDGAEE